MMRGDRLPLRTPLVREFLTATVGSAFDPFVVSSNRKELFSRMGQLADNAEAAMGELAQIAQTRCPVPAQTNSEIFISGILKSAAEGSLDPEKVLMKNFADASAVVYTALDALQCDEDNKMPLDAHRVEEAMGGMEVIRLIALNTCKIYDVLDVNGPKPSIFTC